MDDEGDARMSSPLATRPLKRNKLATPRDKGTPAARLDGDGRRRQRRERGRGVGRRRRVRGLLAARAARRRRGARAEPLRPARGRPRPRARDAAAAGEREPLRPRDLNRCDSIDTNSGSWTFDGGLKPALAAPAAPRRGAAGARRDAAADASSRFRNDFEVVREIGAGSFGTVRKVRSRIDGCLYAVKSTHARPRARRRNEAPPEPSNARAGAVPRPAAPRPDAQGGLALAALSARDEGAEGLRHIVRYYQAWIEDERLYIQTERATRRWRAASAAAASCRRPRRSGASSGRCSSRSSCSTRAVWSTSTSSRATSSSRARTRAEVVLPRSRPRGASARAGRASDDARVTQARTATNWATLASRRPRARDVVEGDARYMSKGCSTTTISCPAADPVRAT